MPRFALYVMGRLVRSLDVDKDEILIGRLPGIDIEVPLATVSRKHARIAMKDGRYLIEDLHSTNGVLVNDRKVNQCYLKPGDRITVETFEIVFSPTEDEIPTVEAASVFSPGLDQNTGTMSSLGDLTYLNIGSLVDQDRPGG